MEKAFYLVNTHSCSFQPSVLDTCSPSGTHGYMVCVCVFQVCTMSNTVQPEQAERFLLWTAFLEVSANTDKSVWKRTNK